MWKEAGSGSEMGAEGLSLGLANDRLGSTSARTGISVWIGPWEVMTGLAQDRRAYGLDQWACSAHGKVLMSGSEQDGAADDRLGPSFDV